MLEVGGRNNESKEKKPIDDTFDWWVFDSLDNVIYWLDGMQHSNDDIRYCFKEWQ